MDKETLEALNKALSTLRQHVWDCTLVKPRNPTFEDQSILPEEEQLSAFLASMDDLINSSKELIADMNEEKLKTFLKNADETLNDVPNHIKNTSQWGGSISRLMENIWVMIKQLGNVIKTAENKQPIQWAKTNTERQIEIVNTLKNNLNIHKEENKNPEETSPNIGMNNK